MGGLLKLVLTFIACGMLVLAVADFVEKARTGVPDIARLR